MVTEITRLYIKASPRNTEKKEASKGVSDKEIRRKIEVGMVAQNVLMVFHAFIYAYIA